MTWVFNDAPANHQQLELTFDESDGATTVRLLNTRISTDERRDSQDWGWRGCLVELERLLAGSEG
jgi:Activator of Hsp90 ATPase homolog 1-like protein